MKARFADYFLIFIVFFVIFIVFNLRV